jgi:protein-tyrosine phosphatase
MNQIQPYKLWVGHAGDGRDIHEVFNRGIKAIVQLAMEEPPLQPPRELVCLRFPLMDGSGNDPAILQLAIQCVTTLVQQGIPTLVCCGGGMSRSPAIVAAALAMVENTDMEQSVRRVIQSHPADVSPGLWDEIRRVSKVLHGKECCP